MNWNPLVIDEDSFYGGILGDKYNFLASLSSCYLQCGSKSNIQMYLQITDRYRWSCHILSH